MPVQVHLNFNNENFLGAFLFTWFLVHLLPHFLDDAFPHFVPFTCGVGQVVEGNMLAHIHAEF